MMDEDEYHKSSKDDGGEWNIPPIERPHHYFHFLLRKHKPQLWAGPFPYFFARDVPLTALLIP